MTPEGKLKKEVTALLESQDVYFFFPAANGYGRAGIPDIICCVNGYFLAIECKAGKGATTALQDRELGRIREHGGNAFVMREDAASRDYLLETIHKLQGLPWNK